MSEIPASNQHSDDDTSTAAAPYALHGGHWIVVGVDGSDSSRDALRAAIRMSEALGTDLVAVAAWRYPVAGGGYPPADWSPESDCRESLDEAVTAVFGGPPPPWFHTEVHEGDAAHVLLETSAGADMLVVGSRGHGGFPGLHLGSVSTTCAEYAKCPVLVQHEPADAR